MHMSSERSDAAIVRCAIEMAKSLGMRVVAEGVENAQAAAMLAEFGCDFAQGFHISRPLPANELEVWLEARSALTA